MGVAVSVLQLDTAFPRLAGDVASPDTYLSEIEILRIPQATVNTIVREDPHSIEIAPFETALHAARGDIVVTSCGFLSYWQDHLASLTTKPFISSALNALPSLCTEYRPDEILTLTFDAESLNSCHTGQFQTDVIGLPRDMHLRKVISEDRTDLDVECATAEVVSFVTAHTVPRHKHMLLECTNLPPYKAALSEATKLPITDILTCIETTRPGTVRPEFVGSAAEVSKGRL